MRLGDEEKAKNGERIAEMRQMSAERKKANARLMQFGEFVDIGAVEKDEDSLDFNSSHKQDMNIDLADAITPVNAPEHIPPSTS